MKHSHKLAEGRAREREGASARCTAECGGGKTARHCQRLLEVVLVSWGSPVGLMNHALILGDWVGGAYWRD